MPLAARATTRLAMLALALLFVACGGGGTPSAESPPPSDGPVPDLGANASLNGYRLFPADNAWNQRVDQQPVDPSSDVFLASIGADDPIHPDFGADWNGGPFGIPYVVVASGQPYVDIAFTYGPESDPGPYPIPPDAPIEGGADATGDRHLLVLDRDNDYLYECFDG
jgi:hypothetical protein